MAEQRKGVSVLGGLATTARRSLAKREAASPLRRLSRPPRTTPRQALFVLAAVALTYATLFQSYSWNQTSTFDLIKALSHGHTAIDPYQANTGDKAFYHGHWYSARAPGLALFCLPFYELLKLFGVPAAVAGNPAAPHGNLTIPLVTLWGSVLPAFGLLLCLWWVGEELAAPYGLPAAVALGLGTLALPLATLLFTHMLAAALLFAAFTVLYRARRGNPSPAKAGWAGLLAGYGVTTEYPGLLCAAALALYLLVDGQRGSHPLALKRLLAYGLGLGVGLLPLLVYNQLAFGSPLHVAYDNIPAQQEGLFGIGAPSLPILGALLLGSRGLLTTSPLLLLAPFGIWVLRREGKGAEALLCAALAVLYCLYNSGYYLPFGGASEGPRFLMVLLPFLGLAVVPAWRRLPLVALALAGFSVTVTVVATITHPLVGFETETVRWARLLFAANFQPTAATAVGLGRSLTGIWPFFLAVGIALYALRRALGQELAVPGRWRFERLVALGALALWFCYASFGPTAFGIDHAGLTQIAKAERDPALVARLDGRYGGNPLETLAGLAAGIGALALLPAVWRRAKWPPQPLRPKVVGVSADPF